MRNPFLPCLCLIAATALTCATINSYAQAIDSHTLLATSLSAMTGGTPVVDVSIAGNTLRNFGSAQELGTISLVARLGQGRIDWQVGSGARTLVVDTTTQAPSGWWLDSTGQTHAIAEHNAWAGQAWFSPQLTVAQVMQSIYSSQFVGAETLNGQVVNHVQAFVVPAQGSAKSKQLLQNISTIDLYLDPTTFFPVTLRFQAHPEDDALTDIPVEVRFSDYRNVNGAMLPFRIQRYQNGELLYDVSVASATTNSGVPSTRFLAQ